MSVKAIRGAIDVEENSSKAILAATKRLLLEIKEKNDLDLDAIINVLFTATPDLNATFPAKAARQLGWTNVPLMCAQEIDVAKALPLCIRVMLLVNTSKDHKIAHIYLGKTTVLREDVTNHQVN